MIKLAFLWNYIKKHKMIFRSRYFASSCCVFIFHLNCPNIYRRLHPWLTKSAQSSGSGSVFVRTLMSSTQCTLYSLSWYLLCRPGRFLIHKMVQKGKKFIKSSGHGGLRLWKLMREMRPSCMHWALETGGAGVFLSCFPFSLYQE